MGDSSTTKQILLQVFLICASEEHSKQIVVVSKIQVCSFFFFMRMSNFGAEAECSNSFEKVENIVKMFLSYTV